MKNYLLIAGATLALSAASLSAQAATTSCADMGKQVEAALKTAKLTAAEKTTVDADIKKADGLCKAKKDADANTQYEAVMKILKKK